MTMPTTARRMPAAAAEPSLSVTARGGHELKPPDLAKTACRRSQRALGMATADQVRPMLEEAMRLAGGDAVIAEPPGDSTPTQHERRCSVDGSIVREARPVAGLLCPRPSRSPGRCGGLPGRYPGASHDMPPSPIFAAQPAYSRARDGPAMHPYGRCVTRHRHCRVPPIPARCRQGQRRTGRRGRWPASAMRARGAARPRRVRCPSGGEGSPRDRAAQVRVGDLVRTGAWWYPGRQSHRNLLNGAWC
jgi:hypothetical protein